MEGDVVSLGPGVRNYVAGTESEQKSVTFRFYSGNGNKSGNNDKNQF